KAIVLFTDGVDTASNRASYESTVRDAEELDALIYPVEFDTYSDMAGGWPGGHRSRRGSGGGSIFDDIVGIILGDDPNNGSNNGGGNYPGGGGGGNYPGSG